MYAIRSYYDVKKESQDKNHLIVDARSESRFKCLEPRITSYNVCYTKLLRESVVPFNMCKLLSGSEGTLGFTTEITLQLDDLPPPESAMVV